MKPIQSKNENYIVKEFKKISVKKLDEFADLKNIERPSIMKLDVQGYELEVLRGSDNILNYVDHIIIEISFTEIYENQASQNKLIEFIKSYSFDKKDKCNLSKIENKLFQEDVLFSKNINVINNLGAYKK